MVRRAGAGARVCGGRAGALRKHEASLRLLFERNCKLRGTNLGKGIANKLVSFECWKDFCRLFELVDIDLTERDMTLAFVWSRMRVADEQSEMGRIKLTHLSFEDWLEALCRCALLKAWPTKDEVDKKRAEEEEAAEAISVGQYGWELRGNDPVAYESLLSTKSVKWGGEPLQHISACIDHLCTLLIVTCQQGRGDGKALTEKEVASFMKPMV